MKTIAILVDGKISSKPVKNTTGWKKRRAVRAIIFDKQNRIPLLWVSKQSFHKIPGGGIEKGENIKKALKREIMEEVGIKIKRIKPLGEIIEHHIKEKYQQNSYCFTALVSKKIGDPSFSEFEKSTGFELKWYSKNEALEVIKKDNPAEEISKILNFRDYLFLKKAVS